ncbi:MAG: putative glycoside hydrolase [Patulibacter sp.]
MVRRLLASVLALVACSVPAGSADAAVDASGTPGAVRFVKRMDPSFDKYVTNPSAERITWLNQKLWRTEVFTPFFDSRTAFYGNGWVYSDLYAIYNGSDVAEQHPEWILKDANGNKLFIPWGCANGTCPQYAADITNPAFRAWWTANLVTNLAKGYRGAWVDDVNLELRVGNGSGDTVAPYSPALGRTMSTVDWRRAMAEFVEQVRAAVPSDKEILHNSIWYAAQGEGRDSDQYVQRQIAAADYINIERGFNDGGLTGGTGEWSLQALQGFIDRVHAKGKGVIIDAFDASTGGMEYSLANYLLINSGRDGVGEVDMTPDNWWAGWDTDLGGALSDRYSWQGLVRRDFAGGMALVNEPGAATRTVTLPTAMKTIDGQTITTVTLSAGQGAVLSGAGTTAAPSSADAADSTGSATTTDGTSGDADTSGSSSDATTTDSSGSTATAPETTGTTCTKVRVNYPTLKWSAKKGKLTRATGRSTVCIPTASLTTKRTRAAAIKAARETARRQSVRSARAARTAHRAAAAARS